MSQSPIYGLSQSSPFAPGVVGLGVSNVAVPVQLLRVTPTVRRAASRGPVDVTVYSQVQNLVGARISVRIAVTAVSALGATVRSNSDTLLLAGNAVAEIPATVSLGPLGNWNVVAQVFYNVGSGWIANPDTGSTDVFVFTGDIVGQEYACSQTVCSVKHAQIDYRDNPSFAQWPH